MFLVVILGLFGLLLVAGGVVLGLVAWRNLRTASLLGRPLSRIGKLRPGFRKVRGKIVALEKPLRNPITRKECVYYRFRVHEERRTYKVNQSLPGGTLTATLLFGVVGGAVYRVYDTAASDTRTQYSSHFLLDEEEDIPFAIEDETGRVEVDPRRAIVITKEKSRVAASDNHPLPSRIEELLREEFDLHSVDERGRFKTLNVLEEALLVGATVTVVGTVETLKDGTLCFHENGDRLIVSERDVSKDARSARSQAIGFTAGAGSALGVGLGCLLGALVVVLRSLLAR